jgi:hypothetical protein
MCQQIQNQTSIQTQTQEQGQHYTNITGAGRVCGAGGGGAGGWGGKGTGFLATKSLGGHPQSNMLASPTSIRQKPRNPGPWPAKPGTMGLPATTTADFRRLAH